MDQTVNKEGQIALVPAGRRAIRRYYVWLLVYVAVVGLYVWLSPANRVPAGLAGTPADPHTFMSAQQLADSSILSAARYVLFFISYPWEWGVYVVLLFSGAASRLERGLAEHVRPRWLRLPVYGLVVGLIAFVATLPVRTASYAFSRHYGITTQPVGGWLRDKLVAFGINTIMMIAATAVALWFIRRGGRWWLKLWLLCRCRLRCS